MTKSTSQGLFLIAAQAFQGAAETTDPAERDALIAMGTRFEAQAAARRAEEAAENTERRAFWAARRPMNWVA